MSEDKTLLSQSEIDTLIAFLTNSEAAPIGTVLDQRSIDKLIDLVKYNNNRGFFIGGQAAETVEEIAVLEPGMDLDVQRKDFELICQKDARNFVEVLCVNSKDGTMYKITPGCLLHNRRVEEDNTEWGLAISPMNFNKIALLFGIRYSSETFRNVCGNFAKVLYGDEDATIPKIYYPPDEEDLEEK